MQDPSLLSDEELLAQCDVHRFRASGPGGQNVNRRETAVRLVHRPTGIVVTCQDERSQRRNRQIALGRLRAALDERSKPVTPRIPTAVPRRARAERRAFKTARALRKRLRRRPSADD
ncbi:MAG: peptide chain release factor-like protein [Candidatus Bipolaricaulota bacterium]|nr:MAG: peptide chain release factor-like protein [Candidatus Bipolaricaulota bacterium]